MGDSLSFGATSFIRSHGGFDQVDYGSIAYGTGAVAGAALSIAIGIGAGSGACQVPRLIQLARAYNTSGVINGVAKTAEKAYTQGITSLNGWDALALAPVVGKLGGLLNKMCFVAGTPVAIAFEVSDPRFASLDVQATAADGTSSSSWNSTWLVAAAIILTAQQLVLYQRRRVPQVKKRATVPAIDEYEKSIPPDDHTAAVLALWSDVFECERLLKLL